MARDPAEIGGTSFFDMLKPSQKQDKQKNIFILTLAHGSGAQTTKQLL